jgi:hypothetical protein
VSAAEATLSIQRQAPARRLGLAWGLLAAWLAATAVAFWWFEYQHVRAFNDPQGRGTAVLFDSAALSAGLAAASSGAAPTLVHFWDPSCPCSRLNAPHVRELMETYRTRGIEFVVAVPPGSIERARRAYPGASVVSAASLQQALPPSAPAAAVLEAGGELAYFGPYSVGAFCTSGSGAFVERALDAVLAGDNPRQLNTLAVGCFCPWPQTQA